jgi:hypothetical protein
MAPWEGRVDAAAPREALRWHQVVEPLDVTAGVAPDDAGRRGVCFVGYRCDDGIARNQGRPGAIGGPASLRRRMANLPFGFTEAFALRLEDSKHVGPLPVRDSAALPVPLELAQDGVLRGLDGGEDGRLRRDPGRDAPRELELVELARTLHEKVHLENDPERAAGAHGRAGP